jgi:hypothetical protein
MDGMVQVPTASEGKNEQTTVLFLKNPEVDTA